MVEHGVGIGARNAVGFHPRRRVLRGQGGIARNTESVREHGGIGGVGPR